MRPWDVWSNVVPHHPPVGHILRNALHDRWLRFHTLPNGKRRPSNETEVAEVIRRSNAILSIACGVGGDAWSFAAAYHPDTTPKEWGWDEAMSAPDWRLDPDSAADLKGASFFAAFHHWCPGIMDPQLRATSAGDLGSLAKK